MEKGVWFTVFCREKRFKRNWRFFLVLVVEVLEVVGKSFFFFEDSVVVRVLVFR